MIIISAELGQNCLFESLLRVFTPFNFEPYVLGICAAILQFLGIVVRKEVGSSQHPMVSIIKSCKIWSCLRLPLVLTFLVEGTEEIMMGCQFEHYLTCSRARSIRVLPIFLPCIFLWLSVSANNACLRHSRFPEFVHYLKFFCPYFSNHSGISNSGQCDRPDHEIKLWINQLSTSSL